MPDEPLGLDLSTPDAGPRRPAWGDRHALERVHGDLEALALRGPRSVRPLTLVRADAVAAYVRRRDRHFAAAGLTVDRRAELMIAAALLRCDVADGNWARVGVGCAQIAAALDADLPAARATHGQPAVTDDDELRPLASQRQRLWNARNTEGVTLGEAVAATRAGRPTRESFDAPAS